MRCPSCDHDNRAERRFCAECGGALAALALAACASLLYTAAGTGLEDAEAAAGECRAQLTLARVLAHAEGATAAAAIEAALQEGERLIAETGARSYTPRLHEERARLAGVLGDTAGRERELRAALRLYTEMGATGHAERLAQELGL